MFSTRQKKTKTPPKADDDEDPFQKLKSLMLPQPEAEKEKNHIYFFRDVDSDSCLDLIRKINDVSKELLKYSIDFDCPPPSIFLHINSLGVTFYRPSERWIVSRTVESPWYPL